MQLISTANNPAPPHGMVASLRTQDGLELRAARWVPEGTSRGTVVICGGRAEFIEKYFEVIGELLERQFHVVAFDWRGQGLSTRELSDPRKGHVDDFLLYERDLEAIESDILAPFCPRPWFCLGHSMGASIVLAQARAHASPFERMVLSAPMIDLYGLHFPRGVRLLAECLDLAGFGGAYIPGTKRSGALTRQFEGNVLTSDEGRFNRMIELGRDAPQLTIGDPTFGWLHAAFRLMKDFQDPEYPRRILTPALVFSPGSDRVVSPRATERFATRLKAGHVIPLPYARHEILMERDSYRAQFWAAFDAFIPGSPVPVSVESELVEA